MHSKTNRPLFALAALSFWLIGNLNADQLDQSPLMVDSMVVTLIDQSSIPASVTGMIAEISVREGDAIDKNQSLGKLDDRRAAMEAKATEIQHRMAVEKLAGDRTSDLAKKMLAEAKQAADEHQLRLEIARRKAGNETRVLASRKSEAVAKNELDRATDARSRFTDSVSKSEIEGLRLAHDRMRLESEQAEFERQNDRLQAQAEQAAATGHELRVERSSIEVEQAIAASKVQDLEVQLFWQQFQLAQLATERHQFRAPFEGVVAEVLRRTGDWVQAGDPIMRVIRLNRLSAEGFVSASELPQLRRHNEVALEIQVADGRSIKRKGQIVFISSEIDPVNNEVKFRIEFDNPEHDVLPGMRLRMSLGS